MEAEVRAPRLVDDQGHPGGVGRVRDGAYVGHRTEIAGGDDVHGRGVRSAGERLRHVLGAHSVGDALDAVDGRPHEDGVQAGQHQSVDDAGVHAALHDQGAAQGRGDHGGDLVALGGAVGQEPGAPRAPGIGGQVQGLVQRGAGAEVDAVEQRREVEGRDPGAEPVREVRARGGGVAWDVQPQPVPSRMGQEGLGVRGTCGGAAGRRGGSHVHPGSVTPGKLLRNGGLLSIPPYPVYMLEVRHLQVLRSIAQEGSLMRRRPRAALQPAHRHPPPGRPGEPLRRPSGPPWTAGRRAHRARRGPAAARRGRAGAPAVRRAGGARPRGARRPHPPHRHLPHHAAPCCWHPPSSGSTSRACTSP